MFASEARRSSMHANVRTRSDVYHSGLFLNCTRCCICCIRTGAGGPRFMLLSVARMCTRMCTNRRMCHAVTIASDSFDWRPRDVYFLFFTIRYSAQCIERMSICTGSVMCIVRRVVIFTHFYKSARSRKTCTAQPGMAVSIISVRESMRACSHRHLTGPDAVAELCVC